MGTAWRHCRTLGCQTFPTLLEHPPDILNCLAGPVNAGAERLSGAETSWPVFLTTLALPVSPEVRNDTFTPQITLKQRLAVGPLTMRGFFKQAAVPDRLLLAMFGRNPSRKLGETKNYGSFSE